MNIIEQKLTINSKYYQQIIACLQVGGGRARLIGGSVRDALINALDILPNLTPEDNLGDNTPLWKLGHDEEMQGAYGAQEQSVDVHEGAGAQQKLQSGVEFPKRYNIKQQLEYTTALHQLYLESLSATTSTRNLINTDIDIATTLRPEKVMDILSSQNIKVVPTGIKFGTVTAFIEDEKFEITTLRRDIECDGRHAKVEFTDDFQEDALRRDFTINAMSYSLDHKVYDYFGGLDDLKSRRVVFVGNPTDRIKEDYLRILRFFRFSCYYANTIDKEALEACINLKSGLITLSRERIKLEMDKLIAADTSPYVLLAMDKAQILQTIFPIEHFDAKPMQTSLSLIKSFSADLDYLTRYSIMFCKSNLTLNSLLGFKFSRQESQSILSVLNFISKFTSARKIDFILKEIWLDCLDYIKYITVAASLEKLDIKVATDFIEYHQRKSRPIFPLTGHDLLSIGLQGKKLGKSLGFLKNLWIESDFQLTKEELLRSI